MKRLEFFLIVFLKDTLNLTIERNTCSLYLKKGEAKGKK